MEPLQRAHACLAAHEYAVVREIFVAGTALCAAASLLRATPAEHTHAAQLLLEQRTRGASEQARGAEEC